MFLLYEVPRTAEEMYTPQVGDSVPSFGPVALGPLIAMTGSSAPASEERRDLDVRAVQIRAAFPIGVIRSVPVQATGETCCSKGLYIDIQIILGEPRPRQRRRLGKYVEIAVSFGGVLPHIEVPVSPGQGVEEPLKEFTWTGVEFALRDTRFLKNSECARKCLRAKAA